MDLINKESHQNMSASDLICDSTVPSEIDLIIEQGLEEISTQVSESVHNSQYVISAQSYILTMTIHIQVILDRQTQLARLINIKKNIQLRQVTIPKNT